MNFARVIRHLAASDLTLRRAFPEVALRKIEQTIQQSERARRGEICFALEAALPFISLLRGQSGRERAIEVFSRLRVWDTENNNGVLIYLLLADHDVEIVADRGISSHVGDSQWEAICHEMENAFRQNKFEDGVVKGIGRIAKLLSRYSTAEGRGNELFDRPIIL
ncbi:MAG: TPM domain-containing protein [Burkholderiales bacterium]